MSSDDVAFFTVDKYDISAFKRTVKHEFSTICTPSLDPRMSGRQILDFSHIPSFHACVL